MIALKELFIMGDIRTTVEYLGELLETPEFKDNTIDTAWLDGLIASKSVGVEAEPQAAVINAAVYRGYYMVQEAISAFKESLEKGQLSVLPLRDIQEIPVEITYQVSEAPPVPPLPGPDPAAPTCSPSPPPRTSQDTKYSFTMKPKAPDMFELALPARGRCSR